MITVKRSMHSGNAMVEGGYRQAEVCNCCVATMERIGQKEGSRLGTFEGDTITSQFRPYLAISHYVAKPLFARRRKETRTRHMAGRPEIRDDGMALLFPVCERL